MWSWRASPRPPVTVSSGEAASTRGPVILPAAISLRITMSMRALPVAAQTRAVKPWSYRMRAWRMVMSVFSSGGVSPSE